MRRAILVLAMLVSVLQASATEITPRSVLDTMNTYRKIHGLGPLFIDQRLMLAAEDRMHDMEEQGYWDHRDPEGKSPFRFLAPRGFRFSFAGENLATGFETVEVLVDSWMASEGHRANVLSTGFTSVGVAIIDGHPLRRANGRSVVVIFAREMVQEVEVGKKKPRSSQ